MDNLDFSDVRTRRLDNVDFVLSTEKSIDIPRDYPLKKLQLLLRGRLTVSGGSSSGLFIHGGGLNLLQQLLIDGIATRGQESIPKKGQGKYFHIADWIFSGTRPSHSGITDGGNADAGTYDFEDIVNLHFYPYAMPDEITDLSLLIANLYTSLKLKVQWGNTASLVSGGDRTLALSSFGSASGSPTLEVLADQVINAYIPAIVGYFKENVITQAIASITDANKKIGLSTGNRHRNILLYSHTDTTILAPSTTLIDKIDLEISNIPLRQNNYNRLQKKMKDNYSLESVPSGYIMLDFSEKGSIDEFIDTTELPSVGKVLDLNIGVSSIASGAVHILEGLYIIGG